MDDPRTALGVELSHVPSASALGSGHALPMNFKRRRRWRGARKPIGKQQRVYRTADRMSARRQWRRDNGLS